jgi:tRNA(Ile)-lysidine synthase
MKALTGPVEAAVLNLLQSPACMAQPDPFWAVAFSGGVDSTALLSALKRYQQQADALAQHHAVQSRPVHAVYVDHQLQIEAVPWPAHCAQVCAALGVPLQVLKVDAGPPLTQGNAAQQGIEERARTVRYRALYDWMQQHGLSTLWCAHHADDQTETVLMQLLRGSGWRGVAGMQAFGLVGVDRHLHPQLRLARPLLAVPKAALQAYLQAQGLPWVEDPSNHNLALRRNAMRHQVLPLLRQHFPQTDVALQRLSEHFQAHCAAVDATVDALLPTLLDAQQGLKLAAWRGCPQHTQNDVLHAWLALHGVRCPAQALQALAQQFNSCTKGGKRQVQGGWWVVVRRQVALVLFAEVNP